MIAHQAAYDTIHVNRLLERVGPVIRDSCYVMAVLPMDLPHNDSEMIPTNTADYG